MLKGKLLQLLTVFLFTSSILLSNASAEITFISASNGSATLIDTIINGSEQVFVFNGLQNGDTSEFSFSTDTDCPLVAMTGGAEFEEPWSCDAGAIITSVTYKGGMSFGPRTDENADSFYITFSNPPTPEGFSSPPTDLAGIQFSLFGDIQSWDLSGNISSSGVSFGVELSGPEGGAAHFRMYLPEPAVLFLGGILGVTVGGKPDPFATVTTNEDGSALISIDISNLKSTSLRASKLSTNTRIVTKKILAGERKLGVAPNKTTAKSGSKVNFAMCTGKVFKVGDKIPVVFSVDGRVNKSIIGKFTVEADGCDTIPVKFSKSIKGNVTAKISYKGKNASTRVKITK